MEHRAGTSDRLIAADTNWYVQQAQGQRRPQTGDGCGLKSPRERRHADHESHVFGDDVKVHWQGQGRGSLEGQEQIEFDDRVREQNKLGPYYSDLFGRKTPMDMCKVHARTLRVVGS